MEKRRYHILIASIIFGLLAWVSVNMSYDYIVVKTISVVLENSGQRTALKYPVPKQITAQVRGNGWMLAGIYLSSQLKYSVNMSQLTRENQIITVREIIENIKLPASIQVIDLKPDTFVLGLAAYKEKRVPITPQIVLNYREGYGQVGPIRITPESVIVGGTKSEIDRLTAWRTEFRKYDDCYTVIDENIPLYTSPTYSVEPLNHSARLQVSVQQLTEKVYSGITVMAVDVPQNREAVFSPPQIDITVRGGVDLLSKLTAADFEATVEYQSLMDDSGGTVVPELHVPADVMLIRYNPERLQFFIRKRP
ncbi:MAG: hypothetical protein HY707_14680 [Ignavibacteriae bacterium]|nr:hypothetical protein [Ignavibacteriota bacterium]